VEGSQTFTTLKYVQRYAAKHEYTGYRTTW